MADSNVIDLNAPSADKVESSPAVSQLVPRSAAGQGAYSNLFQDNMRNAIMPGLYEALREAIPMLDTAINNFNLLDGTPVVVGEDTQAIEALNQFIQEVQVGDNLFGLGAYVAAQRDEAHEQGFVISEHLLGAQGIFRLNVADSKAMHASRKPNGELAWYFNPLAKSRTPHRPSATEQVAQILQHRTPINMASAYFDGKGFVELDASRIHYLAYRVENSDAYGVSLLRSMPVFAETLLTIINAIDNTWERFGDPSYHMSYKCGNKLGDKVDANGNTPLEVRRLALVAQLQAAVQNKRNGHSADFATSVDKDSEVTISIIGAEGTVLDADVPITKVVEQLTSGTGQPAWMLGVNTGAVQGMSKHQSEVLQQGSANRNSREVLQLERLCKIHLRALGISWSDELVAIEDPFAADKVRMVRKAWRIEFNKPNLSDIVAKAQANFMNTQSDILRDRTPQAGSGTENKNTPISVTTESADGEKTTTTHNILSPRAAKPSNQAAQHTHNHTLTNLETRPIANPAMDKIENDALKGINEAWQEVTLYIVRALGLESANAQNAMQPDGFTFTDADKALIAGELAGFVSDILENEGLAQGALAQAYLRAWALGVIDGYTRTGLEAPIGELSNAAAVAEILKTSQTDFTKFMENKLIPRIHRVLEAGVAAGDNPINIAANLKREMGGASWKWEQIARSETAMTWDKAKRGEWDAELADDAIPDSFDWIPAPDACPICTALVAGNPYTLNTLPRVVADTHPSDRCDTAPSAQE